MAVWLRVERHKAMKVFDEGLRVKSGLNLLFEDFVEMIQRFVVRASLEVVGKAGVHGLNFRDAAIEFCDDFRC
jgi:hypothetical protein